MNKLKEKWISVIILTVILIAVIFNANDFQKWLLNIVSNGKGTIIDFNFKNLFYLHIILTLKITVLSMVVFFIMLIIYSTKLINKICSFFKIFSPLYKVFYCIFIIGLFIFSLTGGRNRIIISLTIGSAFYLMKIILKHMKNIDDCIIETSKAIGMSESNILFKVKIPMCKKYILKEAGKVLIINLNALVLFSFLGVNGLGSVIVKAVENKNLIPIALISITLFLTSFIVLLLSNEELD